MQVPHKFAGFFLAAEREMMDFRDNAAVASVGNFHLFGDALTKFSEKCPNVVTHTSSLPKSEIQVKFIETCN